MSYMSTTLTVRTDDRLRKALESRAETLGQTVSEFVREVLEEAVTERPLALKTGHLRGRLQLDEPVDSWSRELAERNWRD